jgi:hypothetical protein
MTVQTVADLWPFQREDWGIKCHDEHESGRWLIQIGWNLDKIPFVVCAFHAGNAARIFFQQHFHALLPCLSFWKLILG